MRTYSHALLTHAAARRLSASKTAPAASDTLTHGTDARPLFWPLSNRRFESPISYRERARHALAFTAAEHLALLAVSFRRAQEADGRKRGLKAGACRPPTARLREPL